MDMPQYNMSMYKKQMLYQQEGKRLISVCLGWTSV